MCYQTIESALAGNGIQRDQVGVEREFFWKDGGTRGSGACGLTIFF